MGFCVKCGNNLNDDDVFCPKCATPNAKHPQNIKIQEMQQQIYMQQNQNQQPVKKVVPKISIVTFILGLLSFFISFKSGAFFLFFIATIITAFITLGKHGKDKSYKMNLNSAGICLALISIITSLVAFSLRNAPDTTNNNDTNAEQTNVEQQQGPQEDVTEQTPEEIETEYKESCQTYDYKTVMRNPEEYVGQRICVEVKVSTVHKASTFNDQYYFAWDKEDPSSDYYWGNQYAIFDYRIESDETFKILEDDVIMVYGEIKEPQDTISLVLSSSEVFGIDMKYAELIAE